MQKRYGRSLMMVGAAMFVAALLAAPVAAPAQVEGQIVRTNDPRPYPAKPGKIRWRGSSKEYAVTDPDTGVTLPIALADVARLIIRKPPELDPAMENVRNGRFTAAIPALEKIVEDYLMLQHDVPAAEGLAIAYNETKRFDDTVKVIERVKENKPPHMISPGMMQAYWRALLETEQYGRLRKELDETVPTANREVVAVAQNMRGDIDMKKGDPKAALVDGYLRTVVLFQDVKDVQPEALYKSMECFEKLGQNGNREKMRKKLLADYPQSSYSRKVR